MNITYHHVGGRDGTFSFNPPLSFLKSLNIYLYEADESCLDNTHDSILSGIKIIPCLLTDQEGLQQFHLNVSANTSSIFPLNERYKDYNRLSPEGYEYPLGVTHQLDKLLKLQSHSLNYLCNQSTLPFPEILTIDAQGAAYEILAGANLALDNCLAIEAEAEILPLYKGQKTVGDVIAMCEEKGYIFCSLGNPRRLRPFRMPIGQRGDGVDMVCHALFLKSPEIVARQVNANIALVKLIFIAIVFGAFDVAFKAIQLLPKDIDLQCHGVIGLFVTQLQCAANESKSAYFPIAPISHFEHVNSAKVGGVRSPSIINLQIRNFPKIFTFLRAISRTKRFLRRELSLVFQKSSKIEKCLENAGFSSQAEKLKLHRLQDQNLAIQI